MIKSFPPPWGIDKLDKCDVSRVITTLMNCLHIHSQYNIVYVVGLVCSICPRICNKTLVLIWLDEQMRQRLESRFFPVLSSY